MFSSDVERTLHNHNLNSVPVLFSEFFSIVMDLTKWKRFHGRQFDFKIVQKQKIIQIEVLQRL